MTARYVFTSICDSIHRYDDFHIHLWCGGWFFCIELCGKDRVCGGEFDYSLYHDTKCIWFYDRNLGLIVTVVVGVTNMILDFLLIGVIRGGVVPLVYFARENSSELKLVKSKVNFRALGKTCFNGASELMTNISMSLVSMLYNLQLLKYAGENGIAAYGVIMYVNFIFVAVFIGYAIGTAPIIGYNYGSENKVELQNVFRKSICFNLVTGVSMCVIAIGMASLLAGIFVGYDETLYEMTRRGFIFYSLSFVVMGVNIYGSSFFTALSNGLVSAVISFLRTLLFQMLAVLVLPLLLGLDGIWISVVVAEIMALAVTVFFFVTKKKQYGY